MRLSPPLLFALTLLLMQCKKNDPSPEEQLPPVTQEGANTFGCLLNGKPWQPDGAVLLGYWPAYRVSYDSARFGGSVEIQVARFLAEVHDNEIIGISVEGISKPGTYALNGVVAGAHYVNPAVQRDCREFYDPRYFNPGGTSQVRGQLIITRLDAKQKIIAGLFTISFFKPGCDTVKITKGRFDRRYF